MTMAVLMISGVLKALMIDGVNDNGGLQRGHIGGGGGPGAAHPTAADFDTSE